MRANDEIGDDAFHEIEEELDWLEMANVVRSSRCNHESTRGVDRFAGLGVVAVRDSPLGPGDSPRSMEDQVLGWIKVYDYKPATAPITVDTRVYSPAQLSIARLFANWMQASYLPKGALGDVLQIRNAKLSPYNQNTAAQPHAYGALAKLYMQLKYGANKKIVPLTSDASSGASKPTGFTGIPWTPSARRSTLLHAADVRAAGIRDGTRPGGRRLTPPGAGTVSHALRAELHDREQESRRADQGPSASVRDGHQGRVPASHGSGRCEDVRHEKQKIARDNMGNQKSIDYFMGYLNTNHEKRVAVLKNNKEKYSARLQETAEICTDAT